MNIKSLTSKTLKNDNGLVSLYMFYLIIIIFLALNLTLTKGSFFWDYSGIGILGIDGICVLLGAIPFLE